MIAILTPCGDKIHPGTHSDLLAMTRDNPLTDLVTVTEASNGDICDRIIGAIWQAQNMPMVTHFGIAEADMRFPSNAFTRLRKHRRDIVGANYWQRTKRQWTASLSNDEYVSSEGRSGLQRVLSLGCGVILIDMRVFKSLPQPWFSRPWIAERQRHIGPDGHFCTQAGAHGFWSWIDHDLSQECAHVGEVAFGATVTRYATNNEEVERVQVRA